MTSLITNGGFETAGVEPGEAQGWNVLQKASVEEYARFGSPPAEISFDGFEIGWLNDNFLFAFVGPPTDLEAALFDDDLLASEPVEDFEEGFLQNQNFNDELDAPVAAVFDAGTPENFEDFEEEFDSNENFLFAFVGPPTDLTAAVFDAGSPEPVADFEEEWRSNELFISAFVGPPTDLTAALFDAGSPEAFEDFEEEFPALVMQTI